MPSELQRMFTAAFEHRVPAAEDVEALRDELAKLEGLQADVAAVRSALDLAGIPTTTKDGRLSLAERVELAIRADAADWFGRIPIPDDTFVSVAGIFGHRYPAGRC